MLSLALLGAMPGNGAGHAGYTPHGHNTGVSAMPWREMPEGGETQAGVCAQDL
jgi:hypothetical protein